MANNLVYICDRCNNRFQVFQKYGTLFLEICAENTVIMEKIDHNNKNIKFLNIK